MTKETTNDDLPGQPPPAPQPSGPPVMPKQIRVVCAVCGDDLINRGAYYEHANVDPENQHEPEPMQAAQ